jgi:SH3 domain protein
MLKISPMRLVAGIAALCLLALPVALPATAESAWVRGEVRLNLRSGPGNQYRILGVVKTGDALQVMERTENWTKVKTAEGEQGWIPAGYLDPQPPPTLRLEQLEAEVASLRDALETADAETSALRERSEKLAADDSEQATEIERLTKENYRLRAGERWAEWITGALVLSSGMALGALLSRISSRRHRQRLRL